MPAKSTPLESGLPASRAGRWWGGALLLAVVLLLGGCETLPEEVAPAVVDDRQAAFEARQKALGTLVDWNAVGKLGLKTEQDSWSATVRWTQAGGAYEIHLSGPLGQSAMRMKGDEQKVTLRTSEPRTYTARDAEALMEKTIGWRLPVSGLRYWLMGTVEPGKPYQRLILDEGGRPLALEQSGWSVRYDGYTLSKTMAMPVRVALNNKDIRARVIIRRWRL